MQIEPQVKEAWGDFIKEFVTIKDPAAKIDRLAVLTAGTLTTLAGQIDLLRSELVEKGVDVAT